MSWRRLSIVALYLAALVVAGAVVARWVSPTAAAAVVVIGLVLLVTIAIKSRNRWADGSLEAGMGEVYAGGEWGVGGDGGGGDGGGGG